MHGGQILRSLLSLVMINAGHLEFDHCEVSSILLLLISCDDAVIIVVKKFIPRKIDLETERVD